MFAWTATSYPTYTSPALYPPPYYARPVPTARERYLQAVADAQAARESYLLELEERRILAALQQRDAWYRAAAQNAVARRGQPCAEWACRPAVFPSASRRQACVRQQRGPLRFVQQPRHPVVDVDAALATLFGLRGEHDEKAEQEKLQEAQRTATSKDTDAYLHKLEAALKEAGFHIITPSAGSSSKTDSAPGPAATPSPAGASGHQSERVTPLRRLARDRAACTIQRRWRSHSADAAARKDALKTIASLKGRFHFLQDTFRFPEHLEFRERPAEPKEEGGAVPPLSFVPANAAVHAFTHELTKLLTLADAVPSHGDQQVREERRAFVRAVEEALDGVERRVAKVWGKRAEEGPATGSGEYDVSATAEHNTQATDASTTPAAHPEPEAVDQRTISLVENPISVERQVRADDDDVCVDGDASQNAPDASAPCDAREERGDDAPADEGAREEACGDEPSPTADAPPVSETPGLDAGVGDVLTAVQREEDVDVDVDDDARSELAACAAVSDVERAEAFDVVYPDSPDSPASASVPLLPQRGGDGGGSEDGGGAGGALWPGANAPASREGRVTPEPGPEAGEWLAVEDEGKIENDEFELL